MAGPSLNRAQLQYKLEHAIAVWDRRQRNPHAGAIALLRLDDMLAEVDAGKPIEQAVADNFNDRLLTALQKAIEISTASEMLPRLRQ